MIDDIRVLNSKNPSKVSVADVRSWASQLASESRNFRWIAGSYVCPDGVAKIWHRLETMKGGIVGLVGLQGVGKSSALLFIYMGKLLSAQEERRRASKQQKGPDRLDEGDVILFRLQRRQQLFASLLSGTHLVSLGFLREYGSSLITRLKPNYPLVDFPSDHPETLNVDWAERRLSRGAAERIRWSAWVRTLQKKKLILIDTPDYSKTDRRLMAKDLEEIYSLWDSFGFEDRPTLVIAIQKEMFRGHFFFDKMERVELQPLRPEQMLEAYSKRFGTTEPFTKDALFAVARMSRGIFRRYLRYIGLTLDLWQSKRRLGELIDEETVREAITVERLAQDMELEVSELFPKQSDLRLQAVRLLLDLEEHGPRKQTELADQFSMEPYALSRLLTNLELHSYITRKREGTDKIVTLKDNRRT